MSRSYYVVTITVFKIKESKFPPYHSTEIVTRNNTFITLLLSFVRYRIYIFDEFLVKFDHIIIYIHE